jgi:hypothetical protein
MPAATKSRLQYHFAQLRLRHAPISCGSSSRGLIPLKIFQDIQNVHTFGWVGHAANPVYVGPH